MLDTIEISSPVTDAELKAIYEYFAAKLEEDFENFIYNRRNKALDCKQEDAIL